ncbi:MAG: hypothetical protein QXR39_06970 [Candidatus Methanomethylicia archaeon]
MRKITFNDILERGRVVSWDDEKVCVELSGLTSDGFRVKGVFTLLRNVKSVEFGKLGLPFVSEYRISFNGVEIYSGQTRSKYCDGEYSFEFKYLLRVEKENLLDFTNIFLIFMEIEKYSLEEILKCIFVDLESWIYSMFKHIPQFYQ